MTDPSTDAVQYVLECLDAGTAPELDREQAVALCERLRADTGNDDIRRAVEGYFEHWCPMLQGDDFDFDFDDPRPPTWQEDLYREQQVVQLLHGPMDELGRPLDEPDADPWAEYRDADGRMLPPWLAFPERPMTSLFWRMGTGEAYVESFLEWIRALSPAERDRFRSLYPAPAEWARHAAAGD